MNSPEGKPNATFLQYLLSIVYMPNSLRILCLTNLFCWSAHVCYSLYFTDFVGEAVFKGDPKVRLPTKLKIIHQMLFCCGPE
jgi:solute carrier family 45 protein 1/2/4